MFFWNGVNFDDERGLRKFAFFFIRGKECIYIWREKERRMEMRFLFYSCLFLVFFLSHSCLILVLFLTYSSLFLALSLYYPSIIHVLFLSPPCLSQFISLSPPFFLLLKCSSGDQLNLRPTRPAPFPSSLLSSWHTWENQKLIFRVQCYYTNRKKIAG